MKKSASNRFYKKLLIKMSAYTQPIPNYKTDAYRKKDALMNSKPIPQVTAVRPVKKVGE